MVDPGTLPADEFKKAQAIKLIEAKELDKISYKYLNKIKGYSCRARTHNPIFKAEKMYWGEASRKQAIEQTRINAVRAGGNAVTNIVCLFKKAPVWYEWSSVVCEADVIQVD